MAPGALQRVAERRRGDGDQTLGALLQRGIAQFGHAEFGDDDVDVAAAHGHGVAFEAGADAALSPAVGRGGEYGDGPSAVDGLARGAAEVEQAADAAALLAVDGLAVDLSREVDLQGGIDRV
ncbi:hypothetical protein D3C79_798780 [compost metagenome]